MEKTLTDPKTPFIDQYVEAVTEIVRGHPQVWGGHLAPLVGKHGRRYRSVPWKTWRGRGYRRGKKRECFKNAYQMAERFPELTYVEGLAVTAFSAIHHAWCVTEDGRVVDPTWRDDRDFGPPVEDWEYLGIPFSSRGAWKVLAAKCAEGNATYGLLDANVVYNDFDPDWLAP